MLRSIHLTHFKSFADAQVTLSPLTVLVDANASGQGDLLDAIRVVQGLARGFSLAETLQGRWEGGRELWKGIRGGAAEAVRSGSEPTQLTLDWEIQTKRVHHPLSYAVSPHPHILSESLGIPSDDLEPLMVRRTPGREHENTHGLLAELDAPLMMLSGLFKEESVNSLVALREVLQRMELLELSPETEERLRTAPRGSIFLIEELERGLPPQRLPQRVELLENVTRERGLQIIATTHSPQVLPVLTAQC
jgi:predicted ATP-dependent endonuclease of OLD family